MARIWHARAVLSLALLLSSLMIVLLPAQSAQAIPGNPVRVTGGGWIQVLTGKATFGFQVQRFVPPNPTIPGNPIRGTFEYHNHVTGVRLHSTTIDTLIVT